MKYTAHAERDVPAPPEAVAAALSGYARLHEWLPGVERSRVLAAEGDVAVVEFVAPPAAPLVLETVRARATALLFTQVDRYRQSGLGGCVEWSAAGRAGETHVRVSATLATGLLACGAGRRLRAWLEHALVALEARLGGALPAAAAARRRKLFELVRTPRGLELRLPGEVLRLPGAGGGA